MTQPDHQGARCGGCDELIGNPHTPGCPDYQRPDPQGARALAERLQSRFGNVYPDGATFESDAAAILGEHGLFVADVTKHEPLYPEDGASMRCYCGYVWDGESYFAHINGGTRSPSLTPKALTSVCPRLRLD